MNDYNEIINSLNQMKWLKLTDSAYPNERRYDVIGTSYSFFINPASILWVRWENLDDTYYNYRICLIEDVIEMVPQKIQSEILFNLEIFKHSSVLVETTK